MQTMQTTTTRNVNYEMNKTNNMAQQNENNELYDLEDLRSEYESTYLAYALFAENADFMNFEQWLEKHKGKKCL
jgi:hypothetical protein